MYRFCNRFSSIQTTIIFQQRSLARGNIAGKHATKKTIVDFDSQESILDSECSESVNYLGIDVNKDHKIVYGGENYVKDVKEELNDQLMDKYGDLFKRKKLNSEGKMPTTFGHVRLDSENIPKYHGQYEKNQHVEVPISDILERINHIKIDLVSKSSENEQNFTTKTLQTLPDSEFKPTLNDQKIMVKSLITDKIEFKYPVKSMDNQKNVNHDHDPEKDWLDYRFDEMEKRNVKNAPKVDTSGSIKSDQELSEKIANLKLDKSQKEDMFAYELPSNFLKNEISALDYLKKINHGKIEAHFKEEYDVYKDSNNTKDPSKFVDLKGYRILKSQIPDYTKLTNGEIVDKLQKSIIFQNRDFIALNKPYGFILDGPNKSQKITNKNARLHLSNYLPELSSRIGIDKLYTVHRLDSQTTGILLLAKNQESSSKLNELFVERKIHKRYLAITKNVPDVKEGIIDIPISIGLITIDGKKRERAILHPEILTDIRNKRNASKNAKRAITQYKVLKENGNAALIDIYPKTGVKHQIRVHLGFGLRCPILGDHKYSNLKELSPQKLPADILNRLKIRQQKARFVPMHLHAYELFIPDLNSFTNIFVRAPLPYHFKKNLASLGLTFI